MGDELHRRVLFRCGEKLHPVCNVLPGSNSNAAIDKGASKNICQRIPQQRHRTYIITITQSFFVSLHLPSLSQSDQNLQAVRILTDYSGWNKDRVHCVSIHKKACLTILIVLYSTSQNTVALLHGLLFWSPVLEWLTLLKGALVLTE